MTRGNAIKAARAVTTTNVLIGVVVLAAALVGVWAVLRTDPTGRERRGLGRQFELDLTSLRSVDPALVTWRELADRRIQTGFTEPRGIAVGPGDLVYVAGDEAVRVFDAAGRQVREFPVGGRPRPVAVARDGTVYVGLRRQVEVYDPGGKRSAQWGELGEDAVLTSIAVAGEDVYVADAGHRVVLRYDRSGRLASRVGAADKERHVAGLVVPSEYLDVAAGEGGAIWVVNPGHLRVESYDRDGEIDEAAAWGTGPTRDVKGFYGCCNPVHIAVLPGGGFVTAEKVVERVKVHGPGGEFSGVVAGPELFRRGTENLDLAVDSAGAVLVLDPPAGAVRVFVPKTPPPATSTAPATTTAPGSASR